MSIPRMSFSKGIGFFTGTVAAMLFETEQKLIINADLFCVLIYCTREVPKFRQCAYVLTHTDRWRRLPVRFNI